MCLVSLLWVQVIEGNKQAREGGGKAKSREGKQSEKELGEERKEMGLSISNGVREAWEVD